MPYKDYLYATTEKESPDYCGETFCAEHMNGDMPCPRRFDYNPDNPEERMAAYLKANGEKGE